MVGKFRPACDLSLTAYRDNACVTGGVLSARQSVEKTVHGIFNTAFRTPLSHIHALRGI
jgi:hypothetical protein